MLGYILRRLLLIPPKLFVISVLLFGVLNLAGGPPADTTGAEGQSASGAGGNQAYLAFRRQFHLDKPALMNLRFLTTTPEVREWLVAAASLGAEVDQKARSRAQEKLDDYGRELVPHLVTLLAADPDADVRRVAAGRLAIAAQRDPVEEGDLPAAERRKANDAIAAENQRLRALRWDREADAARIDEVRATWAGWWTEHEAEFTRTTGDKAAMILLDTRFARYWHNLVRLDLGESSLTHRPVVEVIAERVPYSLTLALFSISLAYLLAIPIGVFSASRPGTPMDTGLTVGLFLLFSLPSFFTGTVLLKLLATGADRIFPNGGLVTPDTEFYTALERLADVGWHLALPVVTYASSSLAALSRYARTGVIDVIRADFVRTARAKGLHELVVIVKHAARNGMLPILTLLGSLLATLVGGSVVIETVFNIPGMGLYLYEAIAFRDYNAVMGVILFSSVLTLVGVFLADLSYAFADPRISYD